MKKRVSRENIEIYEKIYFLLTSVGKIVRLVHQKKIAGDIMLTNGTAVCEGFHAISSLATPKLYVLFEDDASYERIRQEDLGNWWWTDIMKSIREEFGED